MNTAQRISAPIVSHHSIAPSYFRLRLNSKHIAHRAQPGQFVHILPRADRVHDPLLRRAFSVFSVHKDTFEILYKTIGKGTDQMSSWQTGKSVDLIGPLGKPFQLPDGLNSPDDISLLVGGGVGVPPLAMLASRIRHSEIFALIGARSANDVLCVEEFTGCGAQIDIATEDGSLGSKGLITALLNKHLEEASSRRVNCRVYSCGPLPMLRAVAELCLQKNVPCQVSLEENMPCGVGICNGCVVPVNGAGDDYGLYRRVCVDGPVMRAEDINWNHDD